MRASLTNASATAKRPLAPAVASAVRATRRSRASDTPAREAAVCITFNRSRSALLFSLGDGRAFKPDASRGFRQRFARVGRILDARVELSLQDLDKCAP